MLYINYVHTYMTSSPVLTCPKTASQDSSLSLETEGILWEKHLIICESFSHKTTECGMMGQIDG